MDHAREGQRTHVCAIPDSDLIHSISVIIDLGVPGEQKGLTDLFFDKKRT